MAQNQKTLTRLSQTNRKSAAPRRESDLQPVYNILDALKPDSLKAFYAQLPRRTRLLIMINLASLVLVWALANITNMTLTHIRTTSGTFLLDALAAPYNLESRMMPIALSLEGAALPGSLGGYQLAEAGTGSHLMPHAQCLLDSLQPAQVNDAAAPCAGSFANFALSGDYVSNSGQTVSLFAAHFATHDEATQAVKNLRAVADTSGRIGNYAVEISPVDFFYTYSGPVTSFTWSSEGWVYTVASSSFSGMEALLKGF